MCEGSVEPPLVRVRVVEALMTLQEQVVVTTRLHTRRHRQLLHDGRTHVQERDVIDSAVPTEYRK